MHDNFFHLGGDSLLAIRLTQRISQEMGVDLPVDKLFKHTTVREIAKLISGIPLPMAQVDLIAETKLGDHILPVQEASHELSNALITGCTGFLGVHLLYDLLRYSSMHIYCLVRAKDINTAW
ncbi:phosphopantetheine-binding protein, partial [Sansalvadorimonas verongulae]|uniref:phosphopantetheine-binding protein n=1 Tax=Sansalvadorimonas verongulae TaxID=2172824 RepID=UPI002E380857